MQNLEIQQRAKESNIKLWEIAETLGITDGTFSRKLRRELPDDEREKILQIIERLRKENDK